MLNYVYGLQTWTRPVHLNASMFYLVRLTVKFKVQQFRQIIHIQAKWAHGSIKRRLTPTPPNQRTLWGSHTQQPFSQRRSQYSPSRARRSRDQQSRTLKRFESKMAQAEEAA